MSDNSINAGMSHETAQSAALATFDWRGLRAVYCDDGNSDRADPAQPTRNGYASPGPDREEGEPSHRLANGKDHSLDGARRSGRIGAFKRRRVVKSILFYAELIIFAVLLVMAVALVIRLVS